MTPAVERATCVPISRDDGWIGTTLKATYRVVSKIAEGGMGSVYEAQHLRLGQRVAVKLLLPECALHPELVLRFQREAAVVASLGHPHIVTVLDVDQTEAGQPFLVMEYLEGETLAARLARGPGLELPALVSVALQIASALACTHERGIVHRDLKPENVFLVRATGEAHFVKLLDYGVSKVAGHRMTRDHVLLGTPAYMAPEQVRAPSKVDHRADQYALAAIVYEMACGEPPHAGRTISEIVASLLDGKPLPLSARASHVSPDLQRAVMRALEGDPERRFPDIADFGAALADALATSGPPGTVRTSGIRTFPPPASATGQRALAILDVARAALAEGRLDAAVLHAEELFELAVFGRDPKVLDLMRSAAPALDRIFERRVGGPARRLELTPRARARTRPALQPNAEKLLRLAQEHGSVGAVLDACKFPRRHAVRMLAGLLRRGLLELV